MKKILLALLASWLGISAAFAAGTSVLPVTPGTTTTSPIATITSGATEYGITALCDPNNTCVLFSNGAMPVSAFISNPITIIGTLSTSPTVNTPVTQVTSPWSVLVGNTVNTSTIISGSVTVSAFVNNTVNVSAFVSNATPLGAAAASASNPVTPSNQPIGTASWLPAQITVGTTPVLVAAARTGVSGTGRVAITVENTTATSAWLGPNAAVTSANGMLLPGIVGASITINTTGAVYGTATVSQVLTEFETF